MKFAKRLLFPILVGAGSSLLFAQGLVISGGGKPYDPKAPPAISLPEAYAMVTARMGTATNRFYCVSASCLETMHYAGWTFGFSNTNGERATIKVFFDSRIVHIADARSEALLK